jgi:hypothetical protein
MTTADLFAPARPRRKARVMMHVIDAGCAPCADMDGDDPLIVILECGKCGHKTDWLPFRTITEAKRGAPCPNCNPVSP